VPFREEKGRSHQEGGLGAFLPGLKGFLCLIVILDDVPILLETGVKTGLENDLAVGEIPGRRSGVDVALRVEGKLRVLLPCYLPELEIAGENVTSPPPTGPVIMLG
jgi:hypothetical protein